MSRLARAGLLVLLSQALSHAASISGTVYVWEGQSKQPASAVWVVARSADGKEILRAAQTGASGRYQLADLPRAGVRLSVTKPGYFARRAGGKSANSPVDLTTTADATEQDFEFLVGAVISGRITDQQAEPLQGVQIELRPAEGSGSPRRTITDDRGIYRVFGLEPARYVVLARSQGPRADPYYFPGTTDSSRAQAIDAAAGSETEGIDLRLEPDAGGRTGGLKPADIELEDAAIPAAPSPNSAADETLGSISGHVLSAQTGELLKGASVTIAAAIDGKTVSETKTTGPGGTFLFERLTPASYSLQVRKAGYTLRNLTRPIQVAAKQNQTGIELKLDRVPVISGRIRNLEGRPLAGAMVTLYRFRWQKGRRTAAVAGSSYSDDRGSYRVSNLLPGRYIVGASFPVAADGLPKGELDLGFGRSYYPSAIRASQAVLLDVRYGQELAEINIDMSPQATYSIAGFVADAETGGACVSCALRVVSEEAFGISQGESSVAPNGTYLIRGLQPGSYRILADKNSGGRHSVSAQALDISNRDVAGVNLVAGVTRGFAGRIVFESDPPADPAADPKTVMAVALTTQEAFVTMESSRVEKDLTFRFPALSGDDYAVQIVGLPRGGYLKAIRVGGLVLPGPDIDLRENPPLAPVELMISFNSAVVAGQVKNPAGGQSQGEGASPVVSVRLLPRENQSPYVTSLRAETRPDGGFRFSSVAPGSYIAFAVSRESTLNLEDPAVLKELEKYGKSVDVEAGKAAVVELTPVPEG